MAIIRINNKPIDLENIEDTDSGIFWGMIVSAFLSLPLSYVIYSNYSYSIFKSDMLLA